MTIIDQTCKKPYCHRFLLSFLVKAIGLEGDVRKTDNAARVVELTVKQFGRLDILVNAAAGNFLSTAEDLSANGFRTGGGLL